MIDNAPANNPIKLSIVFLNFNRLHETRQTAEKLLQLCNGRKDIEIIAVDNGSSDGSAAYLAEKDGIHDVLLHDNSGIAGYNEGFKHTTGEYILVLDDDSCPKDAASIDKMLEVMETHPELGLLACHIETPNGDYQWSWHVPEADKIKQHKLNPTPFFIGCGFVIQRTLFERIGWYPGNFFLYQNEIAVTFSIKQLNYQIAYHPDCTVIHRGSPNQRPGWRRVFYPTRNTLWLIRSYYPQPQAAYLIFSRLIIGLIRAVQFKEVSTWFKAAREGFSHPVEKNNLSAEIRRESHVFFKQNSIFHQLMSPFTRH